MHILKPMEAGQMVALGWTLLHFCWQGAVFALLYALVDRMTLRASLRTRYGIAMVTLLLMPLTAAITLHEQSRLVVSSHTLRGEAASHLGAMHGMIVNAFPFATPAVRTASFGLRGTPAGCYRSSTRFGCSACCCSPCVRWAGGGSLSTFAAAPHAPCLRSLRLALIASRSTCCKAAA